jgi:hypothetical protein
MEEIDQVSAEVALLLLRLIGPSIYLPMRVMLSSSFHPKTNPIMILVDLQLAAQSTKRADLFFL